MGLYIFMLVMGIIIFIGSCVFAKRENSLIGEIVLYSIAILGILIVLISFALVFNQTASVA